MSDEMEAGTMSDIDEAINMIASLPCPDYLIGRCDNHGTITAEGRDRHGNPEPVPEQCQFCYYRDGGIKRIRAALEERDKLREALIATNDVMNEAANRLDRMYEGFIGEDVVNRDADNRALLETELGRIVGRIDRNFLLRATIKVMIAAAPEPGEEDE